MGWLCQRAIAKVSVAAVLGPGVTWSLVTIFPVPIDVIIVLVAELELPRPTFTSLLQGLFCGTLPQSVSWCGFFSPLGGPSFSQTGEWSLSQPYSEDELQSLR
jgi:hypothetical protein